MLVQDAPKVSPTRPSGCAVGHIIDNSHSLHGCEVMVKQPTLSCALSLLILQDNTIPSFSKPILTAIIVSGRLMCPGILDDSVTHHLMTQRTPLISDFAS